MKMRRSLWRKLLVLALGILTAATTFWTVQHYIPAKATSGLELVGTIAVASEPTGDPRLPYRCTVTCLVKNTSSSSKRPLLLAVTLSDGSTSETRQLSFTEQSIAVGETCEVSDTFLTQREYQKATGAAVTMRDLKKAYTLYGGSANQKLPAYVKATMAISVILFGVFIYSCVALYKSPKKKVHTHHHHHHHHHSSHHHSSDES